MENGPFGPVFYIFCLGAPAARHLSLFVIGVRLRRAIVPFPPLWSAYGAMFFLREPAMPPWDILLFIYLFI